MPVEDPEAGGGGGGAGLGGAGGVGGGAALGSVSVEFRAADQSTTHESFSVHATPSFSLDKPVLPS